MVFQVSRSIQLLTSQLVPGSKGIVCAIASICTIFNMTLSFLVGHPTHSIPSAPCNVLLPTYHSIVTCACLYILPISLIMYSAFNLPGMCPLNATGHPLSDARCIITHIQSIVPRPPLNAFCSVHLALCITKPSPLNFGTGIFNA